MKITIGTKNPIKVEALKESLQNYDFLKDSEIQSVDVSSGVPDQPISFDQTITGAKNRAQTSYNKIKTLHNSPPFKGETDQPALAGDQGGSEEHWRILSFGIEDGLIAVPHTKSSYMNVCVCAIYDGKEYHLGLSSAFEYPKEVMRLVMGEKHDISSAYYECGLTDKEKLGSAEGAIGLLTHGKLTRKNYTKQAIQMALIHLENSHLF